MVSVQRLLRRPRQNRRGGGNQKVKLIDHEFRYHMSDCGNRVEEAMRYYVYARAEIREDEVSARFEEFEEVQKMKSSIQ